MTPFNWTEAALESQYETAKSRGWLPFFHEAATQFGFAPQQLLGIASRESGPYWAAHPTGDIVGDRGEAFGAFQINIRFHPDRENYTSVEGNILRGAKILSGYRAQIVKKLAAYPYPVAPEMFERMVYDSYNRGVSGMWKGFIEAGDPDAPTAHGNYGADAQARSTIFAVCLARDAETDTKTAVAPV